MRSDRWQVRDRGMRCGDAEQHLHHISDPMHMVAEGKRSLLFIRSTVFLYSVLLESQRWHSTKGAATFGECASAVDTPCIFCLLYGCRESGVSSRSPSSSTV